MAWTVDQIISKFRDLTGYKSSNQISDANILIEANHYYQYIFPGEARISEFMGWYTFNTVASDGDYDITETVTEITYPAYVDDDEVNFWTDYDSFYEEYPHDYTTEDLPTDILILDRSIILRPIPDDAYEVRLRKKSSTPDALTSGNLDNSLWGPSIAYGTSIMYLLDKGIDGAASELEPTYNYHISTVRKQNIRQMPIGKRPRGGRF